MIADIETHKIIFISGFFLYLSYFISKNYQTKRLLQVSKDLQICPELLSLINGTLNTLPYVYRGLFIQEHQLFGHFTEISDFMVLSASLILGIAMFFSAQKYPMNQFLFTKSIICSMSVYLILFSIFMHGKINWASIFPSYTLLIIFIYQAIAKSIVSFRHENSVYVHIDDYSGHFSQAFYYFELILKKILDTFCGHVHALENKEQRSLSFFSIPLIMLCGYLTSSYTISPRGLALVVVLGSVLSLAFRKVAVEDKKHVFTKLYGLLSSTYIIIILSNILHRLVPSLFYDTRVGLGLLQPTARSITSNLGIIMSSAAFFNSRHIEMAYLTIITGYIPALLFSLGPLAGLYLTLNGEKEIVLGQENTMMPTSVLYLLVPYLLVLTNCEIWSCGINRDLGIFLISNFPIYVFCNAVRVLSGDHK